MVNQSNSPKGKSEESPSSLKHDAHDITSLSDLPGRKIKTKLWPMSPIESLSADEVMAIAYRDHTPIMIGRVLDGDDEGEQYVCASKKGASLPPEIAAEGSWAQKYYQQVVVLNDRVKDLNDTVTNMQERFQPVWELAKGQQVLSVSVEVFDGLLAVANEGFHQLYNTWSKEDKKSIITKDCDFRSPHFASYYSVLKNYSMGRFNSLQPGIFQYVEDLLDAGEQYLINHARMNGFPCPLNIRALVLKFIPLKSDRNRYSHPLSLSDKSLATTILQRLRLAITNDEFDFMKDSKNLILLGTEYAESVLNSYGRIKESFFMDPTRRSKQRQGTPIAAKSTTPDSSPEESPPHSPLRPRSPNFPLFGLEHFHSGQSSPIPSSPQTSPGHIEPVSTVVIPTNSPKFSNTSALESTPSQNLSPISPPSLQTSQSSGSSQGSQSPPTQQPQHVASGFNTPPPPGFNTRPGPVMNQNQHASQEPSLRSSNAAAYHPQQSSQGASTQEANSQQGGGHGRNRGSKRTSSPRGSPGGQYYRSKRSKN